MELAGPTSDKPVNKPSALPSLGDIVFLIIFLFPILLLPNYLFGDGSTGWHLAIGDYCLQHNAVPMKDFISHTHAGKPWIAFYWLFDVGMSLFNNLGGINGVAIYCSTIIATVFLLIYNRMRSEGCDQLLSAFFVLIGAIASTVHWLARPLISSFAGVYVFSTTLEDFHRRKITPRRLIATLGICTIIWINAHPACIMGFATLVIYVAVSFIAVICARTADERHTAFYECKWLLIAGLIAFAASLLNPWGMDLWSNTITNMAPGKLVDSVDEYKSPSFHGALFSSSLEIVFLVLAIGLCLRARRISYPQLLNTLGFAHLALQNVRNIPVFVVTALPLIGYLYGTVPLIVSSAREDNGLVSKFIRNWQSAKSDIDSIERRCSLHLLPVATVALFLIAAASGGKLFGSELMSCDFDSTRLPGKTLLYIKEHKLPPEHGFNHVNWGGYIQYKTKLPVFIDDRASFFGDDFYYKYGLVVSLAPGWKEYLDEHHVGWIIYPKNSAFVSALLSSGCWEKVAEDDVACILCRSIATAGARSDSITPKPGGNSNQESKVRRVLSR